MPPAVTSADASLAHALSRFLRRWSLEACTSAMPRNCGHHWQSCIENPTIDGAFGVSPMPFQRCSFTTHGFSWLAIACNCRAPWKQQRCKEPDSRRSHLPLPVPVHRHDRVAVLSRGLGTCKIARWAWPVSFGTELQALAPYGQMHCHNRCDAAAEQQCLPQNAGDLRHSWDAEASLHDAAKEHRRRGVVDCQMPCDAASNVGLRSGARPPRYHGDRPGAVPHVCISCRACASSSRGRGTPARYRHARQHRHSCIAVTGRKHLRERTARPVACTQDWALNTRMKEHRTGQRSSQILRFILWSSVSRFIPVARTRL